MSDSQINALIPFDAATLTGSETASVQIVVTTTAGASAPFSVTLHRNAPAIYSKDSSGGGAALAFDANFKPVSTIDGSVIVLYATGLGPTSPPGNTNALAYADGALNQTVDAISVSIGGTPADVLFAGLAPGFQGIYQLNVRPKGSYSTSLLSVTAGSSSAPFLTLPVPQGVNVKNVIAGIYALYPSTASNTPPTIWGISELPTSAAYNVDLDIVDNASAFVLIATAGNAFTRITVDPVGKTWNSVSTVPSAASRNWDFSSLLPATQVLDFLAGGLPFPDNIVPLSRVQPFALMALVQIPAQNSPTTAGSPNATFTNSGSIPASNHLTLTGVFGGFQNYPKTVSGLVLIQFGVSVDVKVAAYTSATVGIP